jgi:uncharacterized membrane protein YhaH (DUF805 family)
MQALRLFFSPSGRLRPRPFALGAIALYVAGAASHGLTVPDVLVSGGLWPFAVVQAVLIWIWFGIHVRRLRDAGRPSGLAVGVGLLYALSVVLLLMLADAFFNASAIVATDANTTSALGLLLLSLIAATLSGAPHYDVAWLVVTILTAVAFVPPIVAIIFTVWTATRPGSEECHA